MLKVLIEQCRMNAWGKNGTHIPGDFDFRLRKLDVLRSFITSHCMKVSLVLMLVSAPGPDAEFGVALEGSYSSYLSVLCPVLVSSSQKCSYF